MKLVPLLVVGVFVTAGAAYVTRAPASLSGCTYETSLMDRGTRLASSGGTAIASLKGPVPTAKISDTVRGTWRTLGFWVGVFGAAVQGRPTATSVPVACGACPTAAVAPPVARPAVPSNPGRAAATKAASVYWSGRNLELAVAIAGAESRWNPSALSPPNRNGSRDHGEWQINDVHRDLLRARNWRNLADNAWMAHQVWLRAGKSWTPWSTYNHGTYKRFLRPVPHVAAFARPMPPLNDSITPKAAPCPSPTTPPAGLGTPQSDTPAGIRTVKDVTSGRVYRVPIPAGPRGVALNFALDQEAQGDWYQWATRGPDRWDCSGLVSEAWKHAGVHFTPQTEAMRREIPTTSTPQPGDLTYHPGHTQMIVGVIGGRMIIVEAAHTGERLRIRPQWMHPTAYLDPTKMRGRNA